MKLKYCQILTVLTNRQDSCFKMIFKDLVKKFRKMLMKVRNLYIVIAMKIMDKKKKIQKIKNKIVRIY